MNTTNPATPGRCARLLTTTAALVFSLLVGACSYSPPRDLGPESVYQMLNTAPYVSAVDAFRWTVIDDPGRVRVEHGTACGVRSRAATTTTLGLRVQQQAAIPAGHQATVFLNGWNTRYQSSDHHVTGLGTTIFNVQRVGDVLYWDAGGILSDKNGDDAFRWCYHYTVLAWNPSTFAGSGLAKRLDAAAIVSSPAERYISVDVAAAKQGAVMGIPSSFSTIGAAPKTKLLMGFATAYTSADHHVLQAAFDAGTNSVSGNTITWTARAILKDRNADDGAWAASMVSLLTGSSVRTWQPTTVQKVGGTEGLGPENNAFALSARSGSSGCTLVGADGADGVVRLAIPNVPFRYAVPMLTAWDLVVGCNDSHVKRAGAAIEDWWYDRAPTATSGTLNVVVRMAITDNGNTPNDVASKITVLGLDPVVTASLPTTPIVLTPLR